MTAKTIFAVHHRDGSYVTQVVHGLRAVRTCSFDGAARTLARKLHPYHAWELKLIDSSKPDVQVFELEAVHG